MSAHCQGINQRHNYECTLFPAEHSSQIIVRSHINSVLIPLALDMGCSKKSLHSLDCRCLKFTDVLEGKLCYTIEQRHLKTAAELYCIS
jgi:hypothetical protein